VYIFVEDQPIIVRVFFLDHSVHVRVIECLCSAQRSRQSTNFMGKIVYILKSFINYNFVENQPTTW